MHKVLWVFYFSIAPFLYTSHSFDSFALKQSFFLIFLGLQSIFFFYCLKCSSKFFRLKHFDYLVVLFFIFRLLSSFSYIPELDLYSSLGTIAFEFFLCIFYLQIRILRLDTKTLDLCLKALTTSSFCMLILQALEIVKPLQDTNRFDANYFHPNVLGITFCSILIYFHSKKEKNSFLYVIAIILLLSSFSKTAYIVYCSFLLVRLLPNKKLGLAFCLSTFIKTISFLIFTYAFFSFNNQDTLSKFRNQLSQALTIKGLIYNASIKGLTAKPQGHGTGLYSYKIQQFLPNEFHQLYPNPNHHTLYKAHNFLLENAFESGVWVFCLLLYALLYLLSVEKCPIKYCLLSLSFTSVFSVHLNYPESQILFLLLLASLASSKEYIYD